MNKNYKTYGRLVEATRALIEELGLITIEDDRDYRYYNRRVHNLLRQLAALWTNPADVAETATLRRELVDAWNSLEAEKA